MSSRFRCLCRINLLCSPSVYNSTSPALSVCISHLISTNSYKFHHLKSRCSARFENHTGSGCLLANFEACYRFFCSHFFPSICCKMFLLDRLTGLWLFKTNSRGGAQGFCFLLSGSHWDIFGPLQILLSLGRICLQLILPSCIVSQPHLTYFPVVCPTPLNCICGG